MCIGEAATRSGTIIGLSTVVGGMNDDPRNAVSIHLWASLVPAAAVIPAQVAYFDVVAVKKLVVGWHPRASVTGPPGKSWGCSGGSPLSCRLPLGGVLPSQSGGVWRPRGCRASQWERFSEDDWGGSGPIKLEGGFPFVPFLDRRLSQFLPCGEEPLLASILNPTLQSGLRGSLISASCGVGDSALPSTLARGRRQRQRRCPLILYHEKSSALQASCPS